MDILGIETSCDETAAAVVERGRRVRSNVIGSQIPLHRRFGGVVPELASRAHVELLNGVIDRAVREAGVGWSGPRPHRQRLIAGIAVTTGPGLIGSLLIGTLTAQVLAFAKGVPVVGVNHLEGHLFAGLLEDPSLTPPFVGLIVSGGHTDLVVVHEVGRYEVLGRTRDDAAGEAFDKVAKLLRLGFPGGPAVDRAARRGNPAAIPFPRPWLPGSWDFSFSGLKTAVVNFLKERESFPQKLVSDVCASFQAAVVEVLVGKTMEAARTFGLKRIVVGGGVAANSALRTAFQTAARRHKYRVVLPRPILCTDNAAMIASVGYFLLKGGRPTPLNGKFASLRVDATLPMTSWRV
ncbi:MAG: tRNA (adenosine(37)-N6)-threonylcarbamoyltransferase complex transferase subunit TsaD [Elusimicrobia bacterium]|nr:tRNA (adenosine(37)-N6)-threonylcarbamoyltransferase complex transferase subunit TsaD [Elusimicrobiota bacterium]